MTVPPELSVAVGSVQDATADVAPEAAATVIGLSGQLLTTGGVISPPLPSVQIDVEKKRLWAISLEHTLKCDGHERNP